MPERKAEHGSRRRSCSNDPEDQRHDESWNADTLSHSQGSAHREVSDVARRRLTTMGNPYIYSLDAVKQGLDWVIANRVKYNIAVVSISQGKVFDNCKVPAGMAAQVATLKAVQVPVISATGNNGNRSAIFSPACLPDVVSVGATDNPWGGMESYAWDPAATPYIARYSNGSPDTDFYANGRWFVTNVDGTTKFMVGTSNATASISGLWLVNRKPSFDATYAGIAATSTVAKNEWLTGRYVFIYS